jgi:hypothetical protein
VKQTHAIGCAANRRGRAKRRGRRVVSLGPHRAMCADSSREEGSANPTGGVPA